MTKSFTFRQIFDFKNAAEKCLAPKLTAEKTVSEIEKLFSGPRNEAVRRGARVLIETFATDFATAVKAGESKFTYALKKILKQCESAQGKYNIRIADLNVDHAATDADGILVTGSNTELRYKPEELKKRNEEQRKVVDEKFSITPHIVDAKDVPKGLSEEAIEALTGFVIADKK